MIKNNKNDNINYYEILVKLEEAKTSVENIDEQNYTIALLAKMLDKKVIKK